MSTIDILLNIMARLRDPENGCPWDVEQNFETIAPYTVEEAYEVADAIYRDNMADLKDELGDLLFQVVFHAQMAKEAGAFDFYDVVEGISKKMTRRHPHVFGDQTIGSAAEQTEAWERLKDRERAANPGENNSVLDGLAMALPAVRRAEKLQKRAARVGFDWPDSGPVFAKIREELTELEAELAPEPDTQRIESEVGDVLFACVNLARHLGVDPEQALAGTNRRFTERFQFVEQRLHEQNRDITQEPLEALDALWDKAKRHLSRD